MKIHIGVIAAAAAVSCASGAGVEFDSEKHTVTFSAVSTDCGMDVQLEFLFVGPDSDRDYESMFTTESTVAEIAEAFDKAGIPRGAPCSIDDCRFWPVGEPVSMTPAFGTLVREMRGETTPEIVCTGGSREPSGLPEAATNMPEAVFALYNCPQSLLQLNDSLDQSPTYGRFQPAVKIPKGKKISFTFAWDGTNRVKTVNIEIVPGGLQNALEKLKNESKDTEIDVRCRFSGDLTLEEAANAAMALSMIDSKRVKIGSDAGFYYRAFLPLEKWRDRKERLSQPPEVFFSSDGKISVNTILEDWSKDDSLDPLLTVVPHEAKDAAEAAKIAKDSADRTNTCMIFASATMKLDRLAEFKKAFPAKVQNWYVYKE